MESGLRRSSRIPKQKRLPDHIYDDDSVRILLPSSLNSGDTWQRNRTPSESAQSLASDSSAGYSVKSRKSTSSWSELYNLPLFNSNHISSGHAIISDAFVNSIVSQSVGSNNCPTHVEGAVTSHVNKPDGAPTEDGGGLRHLSSTRYDILEREEIFLSVSSSVRTDTSDMSSTQERDCGCGDGESCAVCTASAGVQGDLNSVLSQMMAKIDKMSTDLTSLRDKVSSIERTSKAHNHRLSTLERQSDISDNSEGKGGQRGGSRVDPKPARSKTLIEKKSKVEDEKQRTLKVILESMIDKGRRRDTESEKELSSDEEVNARKMHKKMSTKQKSDAEEVIQAILKQIGGSFPVDEEIITRNSDSGTDSESGSSKRSRSRSRRGIKSGAKVKKRPVVRTELWPHTIANEDDGEDVTSENIGLAKFLSCFCYILTTCEGAEAAGRAALLYAVASVLECLPWSEARSFHNVVMTKLEQDRIDWSTDFSTMAEQFLNKKVRLGMRSKNSASNSASGSKSFYGNNVGKGFGNYGRPRFTRREFSPSKSKGQSSEPCRQWNSGWCTYGKFCKKEHCCLTCFNNDGKTEQHRATYHWNTTKNKVPNQRV